MTTKNSLLTMALATALLWGLSSSCASEDNRTENEEPVGEMELSEVYNSGCTRSVSGTNSSVGTIVLKKDGDIVTCEVLNFESNCGTSDFKVDMNHIGGQSSLDSLIVNVYPVQPEYDYDCICPYNITFTIRNIKSSCFYLKCWWFDGIVSFEQSNTVTLEDIQTDATIDGLNYKLHETMGRAWLTVWNSWEGELIIPSEVCYHGKAYTVTDLYPVFRGCKTLTKVTLPSTLKHLTDDDNSYLNPFPGCSALEAIEVDKANPWLRAVDGILFSKDMTWIISYPAASKRTAYTVPSTVKRVAYGAFLGCDNLKTLYVPAAEVDQFKTAFNGTVLPI